MTVGYTHSIEIEGNEINCYIEPPNRPYRRKLLYHPARRVQSTAFPTERDLGPFDVFVQKSWHLGEGQEWLRLDDPENISQYRYRSSEGLRVDKEYELSNLYKTTREKTTNLDPLIYFNTLADAQGKIWMAGNNTNDYDVAYSSDSDTWTNQATGFDSASVYCMAGAQDKLYVGGLNGANYQIRSVIAGSNANILTIGTSGTTDIPYSLLYHNDLIYYCSGVGGSSSFHEITTGGTENYVYPPTGGIPGYFHGLTAEVGSHVFCLSSNTEQSILWEYDSKELTIAWTLPRGYKARSCHMYSGIVFIGASYQVNSTTHDGVVFWYDPSTTSWGVLFEIESGAGWDNGPMVMWGRGKGLYFGWNEYLGLGRYAIDVGGYSRHIRTTASGASGTEVTGIGKQGAYQLLMCANNIADTEGVWREDFNNKETGNVVLSTIDLNSSHKKLWYKFGVVFSSQAQGDSVTLSYSKDEGSSFTEVGTVYPNFVYNGAVLPTADTPVWTKIGSATTEEISPAGYLHIVNTNLLRYYRDESAIDYTVGVTLECSVKTAGSTTDTILAIMPHNGAYTAEILVHCDKIILNDTSDEYAVDTTDAQHIVRVTTVNDQCKVYLDGADTPILTGTLTNTTSNKRFNFQAGGGASSESWWDYAAYDFSGAYSPDEKDITVAETLQEMTLDILSDATTMKALLSEDCVIRKLFLKGVVVPSEAFLWDLYVGAGEKIQKMDGNQEGKTAAEIRDILRSAAETRHLVTFKDIDGQTYSVAVLDYVDNILVADPDTGTQESLIKLRLMQVN
jgi:hypothetical protein